jgi:hypothetical protein
MIRDQAITEEFMNWLGRYSPRFAIRDNERAMADEVNALMRILLKFAPSTDYLSWLQKVTDQLDFQMKSQAWPTVAEIGAVCVNIAKDKPKGGAAVEVVFDSYQIYAARMERGEGVPEGFIFGREAVELIKRGMLSEDTLRRYRSGWFFNAKDVYGEEEAKRMEAEMLKKHGAAQGVWSGQPADPPKKPFNRMPLAAE